MPRFQRGVALDATNVMGIRKQSSIHCILKAVNIQPVNVVGMNLPFQSLTSLLWKTTFYLGGSWSEGRSCQGVGAHRTSCKMPSSFPSQETAAPVTRSFGLIQQSRTSRIGYYWKTGALMDSPISPRDPSLQLALLGCCRHHRNVKSTSHINMCINRVTLTSHINKSH